MNLFLKVREREKYGISKFWHFSLNAYSIKEMQGGKNGNTGQGSLYDIIIERFEIENFGPYLAISKISDIKG